MGNVTNTGMPLFQLTKVVNTEEWGVESSENDESYRRWTRYVRSYDRRFSMYSRVCCNCKDEIRPGEPYTGHIYAVALHEPKRNRRRKLIYSQLKVEYRHWICPGDEEDSLEFHQRMEAERKEAERESQRKAA